MTGGGGFIGSHLTRRLLSDGHQVTVLDDFSTSTRDNLRDVASHPHMTVIEQDVVHPVVLDVDLIYHLACPASPVHYQRDPVKTMKTCVVGSMNVLELAKRTRATVLLASTSEVYGDPAVHPQGEEYWGHVNPIGPRSCYDEGKRCAEALFFSYRAQEALPVKVARIFNTYGPHMQPDDGRVVSNFIVQALQGRALTIFGDGQQTRSFCYVDDMVDGLVRLMSTSYDVTGPVNLGNPEEVAMADLARQVLDLVGGGSRLDFRPLPVDDPRRRCPDITLARELLGWEPTTQLAAGLVSTVESFQDALRHDDPVVSTRGQRRPRAASGRRRSE